MVSYNFFLHFTYFCAFSTDSSGNFSSLSLEKTGFGGNSSINKALQMSNSTRRRYSTAKCPFEFLGLCPWEDYLLMELLKIVIYRREQKT